MQPGWRFCCRKPLMQFWETSRAGIILLQFGSRRGSLHYILWRLQSDWRFDKRRPWGYFGMSVTLQYRFQSCLQMNQMRLSTPRNAQPVYLNHLPVQTCTLHFRTVSILNGLSRLQCAVMHPYRVWQKKVLCNLFLYWVQSVLLPVLQRAKFKTSSLFSTATAAAISFSLFLSRFTPNIRWKNMTTDPKRTKTQTAFLATVQSGWEMVFAGEGWVEGGVTDWRARALTYAHIRGGTQGVRRCKATYGQTM